MQIISEIDLDQKTEKQIEILRNKCFPEFSFSRSYFKQLPHLRCLKFCKRQLVGYMGLDYRVIAVNNQPFKILGIIDLCVDEQKRGQGIASKMLQELTQFAISKEVDFIILISDSLEFYQRNGFQKKQAFCSWLRIDDFKNYGVAFEHIDELLIKPVSDKNWPEGHIDWLGYMF